MQKSAPLISIGMPVYNGELYLEEAINSILNQTFKDFELIISDNASTDRTEKICKKYARKDKRILYSKNKENLGAAKNYNKVFKLSRGKYFKWAAADDCCDPQTLTLCYEILENQNDVHLCYPTTKIMEKNGKIIKKYEYDLELQNTSAVKRFLELTDLLHESNAIFGLIRRDILEKTVLIGNYIGSDNVLLHQLSLFGKFSLIKNCYFYRREHPFASSWNKSIKNQLEFFDPQKSDKVAFPRWRRLFALFHIVTITPLNFSQKVIIYSHLLKKIYRFRRKLIKDIFVVIKMQYGH